MFILKQLNAKEERKNGNENFNFIVVNHPSGLRSRFFVPGRCRTKIAKEKYEQKVAYAKSLLEQKENLEKELSEVNAKLAKIDRGEEVKIPNNSNNYSGQVVYTGSTGNLTLCCITGQQ